MKVFISWSGFPSRSLAEALSEWLPQVLQYVKPFVSSKDIYAGDRWATVLQDELETTDFGVICLTPDNKDARWIHFEAGALSKKLDSRVCPVLFNLTKGDVESPLSQLHMVDLDMDGVSALVKSINDAAPVENRLTDQRLEIAVSKWWSDLEERVDAIDPEPPTAPSGSQEPVQPKMTADEYLAEVLAGQRRLERLAEEVLDSASASTGRVIDIEWLTTEHVAPPFLSTVRDTLNELGIQCTSITRLVDEDGAMTFSRGRQWVAARVETASPSQVSGPVLNKLQERLGRLFAKGHPFERWDAMVHFPQNGAKVFAVDGTSTVAYAPEGGEASAPIDD